MEPYFGAGVTVERVHIESIAGFFEFGKKRGMQGQESDELLNIQFGIRTRPFMLPARHSTEVPGRRMLPSATGYYYTVSRHQSELP